MNDTLYRVYNKCKYDVGVRCTNGLEKNIKAGSFQMLSMNDILFIESMCPMSRFFGNKKLVAVDDAGKEINIEEQGIVVDETAHLTDEEITAMLKKPIKAIEAWLNDITDPTELYAIYDVAKGLDLTAAKLKLLNQKIPNKEWLE